jgi:zinc and cadmium transporter
MSVWLHTLIAVALVCAVPLLATMALASRAGLVQRLLPDLLAFGIGVLLASAALHLLPEALSHGGPVSVFVLTAGGFGLFAGVERLLTEHDHGHVHGLAMGVPGPDKPPDPAHVATPPSRALLPIAFGADVLHNFLDGILIAATFLVRPELGMLTALAIGLHELPRELGTFGLFVHSGLSPRRAVLFNALTAVFALTGAALTLLLGSHVEALALAALPVSAGSMLYIAVTVGRSILPPVNGALPVRRMGWVVAGSVMVALLILDH